MDVTHWVIISGVLTLATWMAAGLVAVFETHQSMRRHRAGWQLRYLTSGFTVGGILSAVTMVTLMIVAL